MPKKCVSRTGLFTKCDPESIREAHERAAKKDKNLHAPYTLGRKVHKREKQAAVPYGHILGGAGLGALTGGLGSFFLGDKEDAWKDAILGGLVGAGAGYGMNYLGQKKPPPPAPPEGAAAQKPQGGGPGTVPGSAPPSDVPGSSATNTQADQPTPEQQFASDLADARSSYDQSVLSTNQFYGNIEGPEMSKPEQAALAVSPFVASMASMNPKVQKTLGLINKGIGRVLPSGLQLSKAQARALSRMTMESAMPRGEFLGPFKSMYRDLVPKRMQAAISKKVPAAVKNVGKGGGFLSSLRASPKNWARGVRAAPVFGAIDSTVDAYFTARAADQANKNIRRAEDLQSNLGRLKENIRNLITSDLRTRGADVSSPEVQKHINALTNRQFAEEVPSYMRDPNELARQATQVTEDHMPNSISYSTTPGYGKGLGLMNMGWSWNPITAMYQVAGNIGSNVGGIYSRVKATDRLNPDATFMDLFRSGVDYTRERGAHHADAIGGGVGRDNIHKVSPLETTFNALAMGPASTIDHIHALNTEGARTRREVGEALDRQRTITASRVTDAVLERRQADQRRKGLISDGKKYQFSHPDDVTYHYKLINPDWYRDVDWISAARSDGVSDPRRYLFQKRKEWFDRLEAERDYDKRNAPIADDIMLNALAETALQAGRDARGMATDVSQEAADTALEAYRYFNTARDEGKAQQAVVALREQQRADTGFATSDPNRVTAAYKKKYPTEWMDHVDWSKSPISKQEYLREVMSHPVPEVRNRLLYGTEEKPRKAEIEDRVPVEVPEAFPAYFGA